MRAGWVVVMVLVAGCAGSTPSKAAEDPDELDLDELEATPETGIIRGVVVNAAVVPVQGVTVRLQDGESTVTNQQGAFGFQDLEPGPYFVWASKDGYNETQVSVDVVAGVDAPPLVKIQLNANPSTAPHVAAFQFHGRIACGLSYYALCGLAIVEDQTDDDYQGTFPLDAPPDWISTEAVWDGTQPTGDQLNLQVGRSPAGPAGICARSNGPSPLRVTIDGAEISNDCPIGMDGRGLQVRMFAWEMEGTGIDDHTGQCVPTLNWCQGPGMALEQDFEVFIHAFYNWVPPEDWRFTQHGDPVPPQ